MAAPAAILCPSPEPVLARLEEAPVRLLELLVKTVDTEPVFATELDVLTRDEPTLTAELEDTVLTGKELVLTRPEGLFDHSFISQPFLP